MKNLSKFSHFSRVNVIYPSVKNVTANSNYELAIEFDNGESGIWDMKPFLDIGVFKKLKKPSAFKQVRVSFDTVEWNSGVDLDPEFVYSKCYSKQNAHQIAQPKVLRNNDF